MSNPSPTSTPSRCIVETPENRWGRKHKHINSMALALNSALVFHAYTTYSRTMVCTPDTNKLTLRPTTGNLNLHPLTPSVRNQAQSSSERKFMKRVPVVDSAGDKMRTQQKKTTESSASATLPPPPLIPVPPGPPATLYCYVVFVLVSSLTSPCTGSHPMRAWSQGADDGTFSGCG